MFILVILLVIIKLEAFVLETRNVFERGLLEVSLHLPSIV